MKPIRVYTTTWCPYCVSAKKLLDKKGLPYEEINVEDDDEKREWLVATTGRRTVPQIFIGEQSIGGSDELHALEKAGRLDGLVGD